MGFSQVLPGLRDIRAHLTAGCLWLLTIWVLLPKLPGHVTGNALAERIRSGAEALNPVVLTVVLGVVAYLIGLTLGYACKQLIPGLVPLSIVFAVVELTHSLLSVPILVLFAIVLGLILRYFDQPVLRFCLWTAGLIGVAILDPWAQAISTAAAVVLLVGVLKVRHAATAVSWRGWLACWMIDVLDDVQLAGRALRTRYLLRRRPAVGLSNEEILRRAGDTSTPAAAVQALPVWRLRYACRYIFGRLHREDGGDRWRELAQSAFTLYIDPEQLPRLQRELVLAVSSRDEARRWFLEVVMDGPGFDRVREEYADLIEFSLLRDHERAYDRLDRLTGEAEYRLELAIPAVAAACAVTYYLGGAWYFGLIGIAVALLMNFLAVDRLRQVRSLLSEALRLSDQTAAAVGEPKVTVEAPSLVEFAATQHAGSDGLRVEVLRAWKQPLAPPDSSVVFGLQRLRLREGQGRGDERPVVDLRASVAAGLGRLGVHDLAALYFVQAADFFEDRDDERAVDLRMRAATSLALAGRHEDALVMAHVVAAPFGELEDRLVADLTVRRAQGFDETATLTALKELNRVRPSSMPSEGSGMD